MQKQSIVNHILFHFYELLADWLDKVYHPTPRIIHHFRDNIFMNY